MGEAGGGDSGYTEIHWTICPIFFEPKTALQNKIEPGMVGDTEGGRGRRISLSSKPDWSTAGQLGPHETLSQKDQDK